MSKLDGKKIAVLSTNGFEDSELTSPVEAVQAEGAATTVVSTEHGEIEGKKGTKVAVEALTSEVSSTDYDGLILPGGVSNADKIRMDSKAVEFVKGFFDANKPVGVICHGGWILCDADVLKGRTLTSYASIKTDLINAGAQWVDEEVHVDKGLVSSRTPDDLPAFNAKLVEEFGEGQH